MSTALQIAQVKPGVEKIIAEIGNLEQLQDISKHQTELKRSHRSFGSKNSPIALHDDARRNHTSACAVPCKG